MISSNFCRDELLSCSTTTLKDMVGITLSHRPGSTLVISKAQRPTKFYPRNATLTKSFTTDVMVILYPCILNLVSVTLYQYNNACFNSFVKTHCCFLQN